MGEPSIKQKVFEKRKRNPDNQNMRYVYLALCIIISVVCFAFCTEFENSHNYEVHDESIHDVEEGDESTDSGEDGQDDLISGLVQRFSSMDKDDVKNHFKDIIRGFSDKGFEDCDADNDKFLDASEVGCFIVEKMGFEMKQLPEKIVAHYDTDLNDKLDSDEVWTIVGDKNPDYFEVLPSTVERNMELLQGLQGMMGEEEAPSGPGAGIFY